MTPSIYHSQLFFPPPLTFSLSFSLFLFGLNWIELLRLIKELVSSKVLRDLLPLQQLQEQPVQFLILTDLFFLFLEWNLLVRLFKLFRSSRICLFQRDHKRWKYDIHKRNETMNCIGKQYIYIIHDTRLYIYKQIRKKINVCYNGRRWKHTEINKHT